MGGYRAGRFSASAQVCQYAQVNGQQHHARRLHHDVRFEQDGVLVSFAVPKRLPEEPGVRHLAVNTKDHPLDYLTFSGSMSG